jgi:hypothetical protein
VITQVPGTSYTVSSNFAGDGSYLASGDSDPFTITKESACAEYTGQYFAATASPTSGAFTVVLSYTIYEEDIANFGNLSLASARFSSNGGAISGWIPISLIDPTNYSMGGTVSFTWSGSIVNATYDVYDISIELNDYYTWADGCNPLAEVTIYKNTGDFITGGGYFHEPSTAAGLYAPQEGEHANFGFNVKFNKKGTNLQGKMTVVFRHMDGNVLKTYQIKTNSMTSLGVMNYPEPLCDIAVFNSKANLKDVSNPLAPISLGGNLDLHVTMTDCGEPGVADAIGITLYGPNNSLWVSTSWVSNHTIEELLDGGNLVVHSGFNVPLPLTAAEAEPPAVIEPQNEIGLVVYPNPFYDRTTFRFVPAEDTRAKLELFDTYGRLVATLFENMVTAGQKYEVEYHRTDNGSSMLIYRMTMGDKITTGKLVQGNF